MIRFSRSVVMRQTCSRSGDSRDLSQCAGRQTELFRGLGEADLPYEMLRQSLVGEFRFKKSKVRCDGVRHRRTDRPPAHTAECPRGKTSFTILSGAMPDGRAAPDSATTSWRRMSLPCAPNLSYFHSLNRYRPHILPARSSTSRYFWPLCMGERYASTEFRGRFFCPVLIWST